MRNSLSIRAFALLGLGLTAGSLFAQRSAIPSLNSNPGALYTLYMDFGGIDYTNVANPAGTGTWGGTGASPGVVPAYDSNGNSATFSSGELQAIRDTWARMANAYVGFNINVTTVDPAPAGSTDAQRQAFYDTTRYVAHTQYGGTYNWYGAAGGVSYVGTAQNANVASGLHSNWVFPVNGSGTSAQGMAAAGIHEDGHIMRLPHQRDESNGGGYSDNNGANGNGSYAPIMGTTYVSQRGTWRVGSAFNNVNDVAVLQSNANIGGLLDDGRGHSFGTATPLAFTPSGIVDVNNLSTKGFIMPKASANYTAVGANNYTMDYFSFSTTGGAVTLTVNDGNDLLTRGIADPGATFRGTLKIYDAAQNLVASGAEDATTLLQSYSGTLAAGNYYAEVASIGASSFAYEPNARYFNMGGYFLTGRGFAAVPEPATLAALGVGVAAMMRRRRRSN